MSSRTFTLIRNLVLTAVYVYLCVHFNGKGNSEASMMSFAALASVWLHSGRDRRPSGPGLTVLIPLACAFTLLGCDASGPTYSLHWPGEKKVVVERQSAPLYGPQSKLLADSIEMLPAAAPSYTASRGGLHVLNTDGLFYTQDANGLLLKLHAAQSYRTSADCSALASPVNGDVCYDTAIPAFRYYSAGWSTGPTNDALLVHLAGSETITGTKTFSGGILASGATAINWSGSTADFTFSTGDLIWNGAAGKDVTLTQGVSTSGSPYALKVIGGAHTTLAASTEANDVYYDLSRTAQWATGALATQRAFLIDAPTYGFVAASTITNAATLAIENAPQAGTNATLTNAWALWVQAGATRLAGALSLGGNVTMTTATTLAAGSNTLIGSVADKLNAAHLAIASQASQDLLVANAATTFTRLAVGTEGQRLSVVSGAVAWATVPYSTVSGGATTALGAATAYLTAAGQAGSATEIYLALVTRATTSRNLYCFAGTAPGGADTVVFTVRENASDMTLTCTITGAATTCNDTSNSFASVAGDRLSIKAVSSGVLAAGLACTFEES